MQGGYCILMVANGPHISNACASALPLCLSLTAVPGLLLPAQAKCCVSFTMPATNTIGTLFSF